MQRLHMDDLVGHVREQAGWEVLSLPAIAECDETFVIENVFGAKQITRKAGEVLHPEREPIEELNKIQATLGEYNFSGQYQQSPVPRGGGFVKEEWLPFYEEHERPLKFDQIIQSWDTANKETELSDFSVCTTWGVYQKKIYLLDVYRERLDFPKLKRAVMEQSRLYSPNVILIEDKASGTALIQDLRNSGLSSIKACKPEGDKVMRMHAQTAQIEGGFVLLPKQAPWLSAYIAELTSFPKSKYDDQVDSTSQALRWFQEEGNEPGILRYYRELAEKNGYRPRE
jgi:predicted phage terminase large subunit-like protein